MGIEFLPSLCPVQPAKDYKIMSVQYYKVVPWDASLVDVEVCDSDVSSGLKGLAQTAVKITAGAPSASTTAGNVIAGCLIQNAVTGIVYQNVGTSLVPVWSEMATATPTLNSISVNIAGLRISGGSASPLAQAHIGFNVTDTDTSGVPVAADTNMAALAGGNLAFDNGTVPVTTDSCRVYTFLASVSPLTGAVTLSTINGPDFPKHRPMHPSTDVNFGDGTKAIIGYLYVKNESAAVFIPNTTDLDASGITASFSTAS